MFIWVYILNLSCKIALGTNDLLQPQPEQATLPLGGLPVDVTEDHPDGGDQGLFSVVRGSVDISLRYAAHKIVKHIKITRARRPDLRPLGQVSVEEMENCYKDG